VLSTRIRLSIAAAAAFALMLTLGARATFAQDAGPGPDSDWERTSPDGDSSSQVLELPQATCTQDGIAVSCDDDSGTTASGGPSSYDDDTASNDQPPYSPDEVGTLDDYVNGGVYPVPYGLPAGLVVTRGPINGSLPQLPPFAYTVPPGAGMSAPLTPAARPPLSPGGPWMTPPSMMTMGRPAGSPMATGPATFRLH
jgi:hypothetical protein